MERDDGSALSEHARGSRSSAICSSGFTLFDGGRDWRRGRHTIERFLPPPNEIGIEAAEQLGRDGGTPGLAIMNTALVEKVVNAVLYEGYILYPYRASSKKNRERFTFGRVYPEDYSIAQHGAEPSVMQTECLVRNESKDAVINDQRPLSPSDGARSRNVAGADHGDASRGRQNLKWCRISGSANNFTRPGRKWWSRRWRCRLFRCAKRGRWHMNSSFPRRARSNRFAARTEEYRPFSCAGRMRSAGVDRGHWPNQSTRRVFKVTVRILNRTAGSA